MSVNKLLSRIVPPENGTKVSECEFYDTFSSNIASDALTQFSCVFSALIHDIDHQGVPNMQLVEEGSDLAILYAKKSIAEQNSFDLAWKLLASGDFDDLRRSIYCSRDELLQFRQLVINSVMATG
jgi:hypothetical protein